MTQATSNSHVTTAWDVLSLRLTAFLTEGPSFDPTQAWIDVVGDDPEEEQNKRRAGEFLRSGGFAGMQLRLIGRPRRVDWISQVSIGETLEEADPRLLRAVPWDVAYESISSIASRWLNVGEHAVSRLAFGAVLVQPVADLHAGYAKLSEHLSTVSIDPDRTSDFLYQINRRRASKVIPDLEINRLTKWSVMAQGVIQFSIDTHGRGSASQGAPEFLSHAARLELDINTASGLTDALPHEQLASIFEELVALGFEIAEHGDIP